MMFLVFWSFNENISLGKKENKKKKHHTTRGNGDLTSWGGGRQFWRCFGDAPQRESTCWVSLDQELMERLPSAKEEASHRRTDKQLQGEKGKCTVTVKYEFHYTNNKCFFFSRRKIKFAPPSPKRYWTILYPRTQNLLFYFFYISRFKCHIIIHIIIIFLSLNLNQTQHNNTSTKWHRVFLHFPLESVQMSSSRCHWITHMWTKQITYNCP